MEDLLREAKERDEAVAAAAAGPSTRGKRPVPQAGDELDRLEQDDEKTADVVGAVVSERPAAGASAPAEAAKDR